MQVCLVGVLGKKYPEEYSPAVFLDMKSLFFLKYKS